jgi:hypothetical protein
MAPDATAKPSCDTCNAPNTSDRSYEFREVEHQAFWVYQCSSVPPHRSRVPIAFDRWIDSDKKRWEQQAYLFIGK